MADNVIANPGAGGATFRSLADSGGIEWTACVVSYATTISPGANVLQPVTSSNPLPVSAVQSGSWTISGTSAINLSQIGGSAVALGQATMAGSFPVVLASNQSAIPVSQSGSWTVSGTGTFTVSGAVTANAGTGTFTVAGNVASGTADSGNPVKAGWVFNTTQPTVTTGQRVDAQATARGALIVATGVDAFTVAVSGTTTVAGTVTANQGGAPWTQNVTQFGGTNVVTGTGASGAGIPRVTVSNDSNVLATQSGSWTVSGSGTFTVGGTAASGAAASGNPVMIGAVFNTTQPTVTTGQVVDLQATARGGLIVATGVDTFNVTVNAALPAGSNTIGAVTQASGPWTSNVTQFGGTNISTGTGAGGAGIPRVTVSNDSNILATQSGTWNVTVNTALPAGTNQIGHVIVDASASGVGLSTDFASALTTTVHAVKASSGRLYNLQVQNPNSSDCWVQIFDLATGSVTLGTTTPKKSIVVPALGVIMLDWNAVPVTFATAISVAATTTATGSTAPTTGLVWNADYV